MSENPEHAQPADEVKQEQDAKPHKRKPAKYLPTPRVSFEKQVALLRAFGHVYEETNAPVTNEAAAPVAGLKASTTQLCNAFFVENGFLERVEGGAFKPAAAVRDFARSSQWHPDQPERAGEKLHALMKETWFGRAVLLRLGLQAKSRDEAILVLAEASDAPPDRRDQLETVLQYLELAQVVRTVDDKVEVIRGAPADQPPERKAKDAALDQGPKGGEDEGDRERKGRHEPAPRERDLSGFVEIVLSVPDKANAEIALPADFDKEDYNMLRVQLDAYMRRKFGWQE